MIAKIIKGIWCVFLTCMMVARLWDTEQVERNWEILSQISLPIVLQNLVVVSIVVMTFLGLIRVAPFLKHSVFSLFGRNGTNFHLVPADVKYFGPIFLILFMWNVPEFAHMEEMWFRNPLTSWKTGVVMSMIFGLIHCFVGVALGVGLVISIAGFWFTHQFFIGGVELSTVHHTTYNLIFLSLLLVVLLRRHLDMWFPISKRTLNC